MQENRKVYVVYVKMGDYWRDNCSTFRRITAIRWAAWYTFLYEDVKIEEIEERNII